MVKWGNLYVYADSPLISKHVFFDILKPYKIVRGYLRRNKDSTDGHFKVIHDKKARKEQRRTWREGYSITVSKARESYTSKENQLEKLKEKITDRNQRSHKENIEKIIYQTLNSNNFIKNPLIIKKKEIENIQSNQEKHENILNEIKETIQKAIPQMKSKRIIQKDLQEFINKSVNYSYLKTYKQHNPYSYQRTHNLQQEISDSLIQHNWEIDTNLRKTINYRNSKYYMETNFNKILQILDSYKLIIRKSFLNIFEILNIINNFHPLRIIQKGNHQAEIWDRKNNILNLFRDCKNERNRIPRNFKIQLKTTEGNKIETIKGTKLTKINQFSFRIASININGLNKIGKIQKLEKIFLQQRITIAIIQETHLRKRLYFENYHSFEKQGYGTTAQGGIAIIIKKCISKYAQEIKHPDKDIIQIKIGELNIIGVYMRHGTQSQMMNQLNDIIEKLGEERYIIAGDFNQTDKEMEKHFRFNTQIIHNTENSAIRNIDHFCVKNQNREILSQTVNINQEENLSDHKMIVTIEKINILSEERKEYYQPTKQQFQDMITEKLRKQNLSEKSMLNISIIKNVKEKFKKRSIIHINTKNKIGINLTEFNSKNKYNWKQALRKRWRETMRGIEIDNQSKTNYWKEVKRITKSRKDTIFNNNEKEKEFKQLIDKIKIPVQESILQEIENKIINTEPDIRSIKQIFPHDKLIKTIQNSRNSSTCDYDKIEMYQNPYIEREHPKYYEFIKSVNRMMREWIRDPNQEVIKYMLSRRMVFIFKQGDPNQISNYRPISINNALVRIFLKRILEEIEPIWEYISYQQMGFRKMMDTRIAVLELQKKLKEIKEPYIISIDIQKCFDTIDHGLIRKVINKFISNNNIKKLLNEYYKGNGCGIYQGDPLSPLIFGMVSHFIIEEIKLRVDHIQMYADDMILLVKNSYNKVITKVQSILQILENYGLRPNKNKTIITKQKRNVKYLGIILDAKKHIENNIEKCEKTFQKLRFIIQSNQISNHLKIIIYKMTILPQLYYGTEALILRKKQYQKMDLMVNKHMKLILKINFHSPTLTFRNETNTPSSRTQINVRRWKIREKLDKIEKSELKELCPIFTNERERNDKIWENQNLKIIQKYLFLARHQEMSINSGWKTIAYSEITKLEPKKPKIKTYLKYQKSTILMKLRIFTNGLKSYSHHMRNSDVKCPCCGEEEETLDHFLWKCPMYQEIRNKWLKSIHPIKQTIKLMKEISRKGIYDKTIEYIQKAFEIRSEMIMDENIIQIDDENIENEERNQNENQQQSDMNNENDNENKNENKNKPKKKEREKEIEIKIEIEKEKEQKNKDNKM